MSAVLQEALSFPSRLGLVQGQEWNHMYDFDERKMERPSFRVLGHEEKIISYSSEMPRERNNFCL